MKLYPAIDIRGGNCVRLYQGDYDRETVYGDNPADQAAAFADEGAAWIHCVDLDAARSGDQQNLASIAAIAERVDVPLQVERDESEKMGLVRFRYAQAGLGSGLQVERDEHDDDGRCEAARPGWG